MAHTITYTARSHDEYLFHCRCGATGEARKTKQMTEDDARKHLDLIARIRKPTTCSLDTEYRHAKAMSEDPNASEADRLLWVQMAGELAKRLGLDAPPSVQEELFTVETKTRSNPS